MSSRLYIKVTAIIVLALSISCSGNRSHKINEAPARGQQGMVASAHPLASAAGIEILEMGGNAVDAAVATAFALSVVEPYSSGLGGGGFMLILPGNEKAAESVKVLDYRETAPAAAHRDMYLQDGEVVPGLSTIGHLAVGVPGTVAGLDLALKNYGTMTPAQVMAPAIRYAEQGFAVDSKFHQSSLYAMRHLRKYPASAKTLLDHGLPYPVGKTIKQPDLAKVLRNIAEQGPDVFYKGWIADAIVAEMQNGSGLITAQDLASYKPRMREPVIGTYRGYKIASMPPPSSGGTHVIQMLNILEGYDLGQMGYASAETVHILAETMRRAFADRAEFMGDPDFADVPLDMLLSKDYAATLRSGIDLDRATPSADISPGNGYFPESLSTTHLSVVDKDGGAVSLTQTVNTTFGSCVVVPGTGIVLNNEMDDFSSAPGEPNAFGLVQGEANSIAPGKVPLSSMSPTIVFRDDELFMVIGSPGGPRIITTVLQSVLNVVDYKMDIQSAVSLPRVHHQWLPDQVLVESGRLSASEKKKLKNRGHKVKNYFMAGNAQGILVQDDVLEGGSDPRGVGEALGY